MEFASSIGKSAFSCLRLNKFGKVANLGPGEYVPDMAFTKPAELPRPKIIKPQRNYAYLPGCISLWGRVWA